MVRILTTGLLTLLLVAFSSPSKADCFDTWMSGSCSGDGCKQRQRGYSACVGSEKSASEKRAVEARSGSDPNLRRGGATPTSRSPSQRNITDLQAISRASRTPPNPGVQRVEPVDLTRMQPSQSPSFTSRPVPQCLSGPSCGVP